jgi:hypothetical protein
LTHLTLYFLLLWGIFQILKIKERLALPITLPFPSKWRIDAWVGGRPVIFGILVINSIIGNRVTGTLNFRGTPIPIHGIWNERTKQITFDSPYAQFSGNLTIFDEPPIRMRHFILRGILKMMPPSLQAGEQGTWIATNDTYLNQT